MDALKKAIEIVGSQVALANALGIGQSRISMLIKRNSPVPVELCEAIERVTEGKVTRQELRPDIPWIVLQDAPEGFELKEGDQVIRLVGGQWVRVLR